MATIANKIRTYKIATAAAALAGIAATNTAQAVEFMPEDGQFKVERGDTLGAIAKKATVELEKYGFSGITFQEIAAENKMNPNRIGTGKVYSIAKLKDAYEAKFAADSKTADKLIAAAEPVFVAVSAEHANAASAQMEAASVDQRAISIIAQEAAMAALDAQEKTEKTDQIKTATVVAEADQVIPAPVTTQELKAGRITPSFAGTADIKQCTPALLEQLQQLCAQLPAVEAEKEEVVAPVVEAPKVEAEEKPAPVAVVAAPKAEPKAEKPVIKPTKQTVKAGAVKPVKAAAVKPVKATKPVKAEKPARQASCEAEIKKNPNGYKVAKSGVASGVRPDALKEFCASGGMSRAKIEESKYTKNGKAEYKLDNKCKIVRKNDGTYRTQVIKGDFNGCCDYQPQIKQMKDGKWIKITGGSQCRTGEGSEGTKGGNPPGNPPGGAVGGGCSGGCGGGGISGPSGNPGNTGGSPGGNSPGGPNGAGAGKSASLDIKSKEWQDVAPGVKVKFAPAPSMMA